MCNADADVNADADTHISKWSSKTTVSYLEKDSGTENWVWALFLEYS